MAPVTSKASKEGAGKTGKAASAPKNSRAHPPYSEMINEAIIALKERTGSSQFAIAKFIEERQKTNLPNNFKKLLLVQLKKLVANGKLVKVKSSFKLPPKNSSTNVAAASVSTKPIKASAKSTSVAKKPKTVSNKATSKKATSSSAKKPKSSSTKPAAKKLKPKAKEVPPKKVAVVAKAKKPQSIKSPVKKVAANKGKK